MSETVSWEVFAKKLETLEKNPRIQNLKQFPQHKTNTTFQHCHNVAVFSFYLGQRLGWDVDLDSLLLGAMLHDYYLYDARNCELSHYRHSVQHPKTAAANAGKYFALNRKTKNIIRSHMWPMPFCERPRSREAVLVSIADKYCAYQEMRKGIREVEQMIGRKRMMRLRYGI